MKGSVKIMDGTGHTPLLFDTERPEGYTEEETGVVFESLEVVTERIKREMETKGSRLFTLDKHNRGEMVEKFDPERYEKLLLVPALQGG